MKKIIPFLIFLMSSCVSPVTDDHWVDCAVVCLPMEVVEACNSFWKGKGCKCEGDEVIWLDDYDDILKP